jgi:hypothetical protein
MPSIPASTIVNILPGVVGVGGNALDLIGLFLTANIRVPIGTIARFTNAADVATYFGPTSAEAGAARTYFAGYTRSFLKPAAMLFKQYAPAAVSAYLRSGNLSGLTLAQLQALSGVLTITVDGTAVTSGAINLAATPSFSAAAATIQAAFTAPGFAVTYDSTSGAFVFTNSDKGAASTISLASGTLAAGLALTQATGAVTSQGAAASTPADAMASATAATQNFATFTTLFKPSTADMLSFAGWCDGQARRFLYLAWDSDAAAMQSGDTTSFAYQVAQLALSGTVPIWDQNDGSRIAAFLMGALASIDFSAAGGRTTAAFLSGAGVPAGVSSATIARNLEANGWNYYGAFATANDGFSFFYPGTVTGSFLWIDTFVNEIWMNSGFQLALMRLLVGTGSIPYNSEGYALIEAAMLPTITAAVNFGAIKGGVTLSSDQIAAVNTAAGRDVATTLATRGWYALVKPADATTRAARSTPPVYFWYVDGQSVQRITLSSLAVE